jgi:hypothetical protein
MQLMVEGDKWELYIPSEMAYGDRGSPPKIGAGDVLVFTIEILRIKGGKKPASRCDVKSLEGCTDKARSRPLLEHPLVVSDAKSWPHSGCPS